MSSKVLENIWRLLEEFKIFTADVKVIFVIIFLLSCISTSTESIRVYVPLTDMYRTNRAIEIVMEAKEGDVITTKVKPDSKKCLVKELKVAKHLHTSYLTRL